MSWSQEVWRQESQDQFDGTQETLSPTQHADVDNTQDAPTGPMIVVQKPRAIAGREFVLNAELPSLAIGRSRKCGLQLATANKISSRHCRLFLKEIPMGTNTTKRVFIEDTGSANGTFVNQMRLKPKEHHMLSHLDEIELSGIRQSARGPKPAAAFIFRWPELAPAQQTIVKSAMSEALGHDHDTTARDVPADERNQPSHSNPRGSAIGFAGLNLSENGMFSRDSPADKFPTPLQLGSQDLLKSCSTVDAVPRGTSGEGEKQSAQPARTIESLFEIHQQLGSGANGTVVLGIHRQTGEQFAIKIIDKKHFMKQAGGKSPDLYAEANMLRSIQHPSVTKFQDVIETENSLYVVMEYVKGGELLDRIMKKTNYGEDEAAKLIYNVLVAVKYLHDRNIVHRDLKPENILLASATDDTQIKITDFGLARLLGEQGAQTFCGTPQYFAPEVLERKNTVLGLGHYGKAADMWSIGVILYVLLAGMLPFANVEVLQRDGASVDFSSQVFSGVSDLCLDLVKKLLDKNARSRLTVDEALRHEYILRHNSIASMPAPKRTVGIPPKRKAPEACAAGPGHGDADCTNESPPLDTPTKEGGRSKSRTRTATGKEAHKPRIGKLAAGCQDDEDIEVIVIDDVPSPRSGDSAAVRNSPEVNSAPTTAPPDAPAPKRQCRESKSC